ncbi:MAG: ABC transporter permease [Bacteroidia bacterium]|nr:MAG: ABC transporter permease [Bacteroidia bacterium]
MLKNIGIVLQKEYLTRVRQKTFIIATILTPIGFILLGVLPALITVWSSDDTAAITVWVIDEKKLLDWEAMNTSEIVYKISNENLSETKDKIKNKEDEAILVIPESFDPKTLNVTLYSSKSLSINTIGKIKSQLKTQISEYKLNQAQISKEQRELLNFSLDINTVKILEEGEEKTSALLAVGIGYVMAILIYLFLLMYGSMVMRGVVEEKSNRIMEIIVSTVKPIELMIGKILGIALVGLTQFSIWVITILLFNFILGFFITPEVSLDTSQEITKSEMQNIMNEVYLAINSFKISLIFHFIFYFLGGYILYGSLFAAIGAMIDNESDAQQLSLIVIFPVLIPFLLIGNFIQNPNGSLAVFMSIFPLFSSITMMIRLAATDVSWLQLILSQVLLVLGVIGLGWLSARIFRVGILLYGKKYSLKDAMKWVFYKNG